MAFECLDIVGINIPCEEDPTKIYLLDDLGLSLAKSAEIADERYITGRNMVQRKIEHAKKDVISHLTRNVTPECSIATQESIMCYYADRIAKAIWYRASALIYKDLAVDSTRYNNYVAYSKDNAIVNALLYDSSFEILAQMSNITVSIAPGQYQIQLEDLEPVRTEIELYCCTDCVGSRWQIVLP